MRSKRGSSMRSTCLLTTTASGKKYQCRSTSKSKMQSCVGYSKLQRITTSTMWGSSTFRPSICPEIFLSTTINCCNSLQSKNSNINWRFWPPNTTADYLWTYLWVSCSTIPQKRSERSKASSETTTPISCLQLLPTIISTFAVSSTYLSTAVTLKNWPIYRQNQAVNIFRIS